LHKENSDENNNQLNIPPYGVVLMLCHVFKIATEMLKITMLNEPSSPHEKTISCLICVGKLGVQLIALHKGFAGKKNLMKTIAKLIYVSLWCSPHARHYMHIWIQECNRNAGNNNV
jgi:hypothetical protein